MATRPHDPNEPGAIRTSKLKTNSQGFWEVHWSEAGRSRRRSCNTKDAHEARRWLKDWQDEIRLALSRQAQAQVPTIETLCEAYLAFIEARGRTNGNRVSLVPVRRELGFETPDELVGDWQSEYMARRPVSSGTLRRELGALRAALNWGIRKKLVPADMLPEFELPAGGPPRDKHLDWDQEQRLWDFAVQWGHRAGGTLLQRETAYRVMLFVCVAMSTSARRGAIQLLTWDRIDLARGLIDFRLPGERITNKRKVLVPIADRLMPVLQEAATRASRGADGRPIGRLLGDLRKVNHLFAQFTAAAGVGWVTPHVLRHTWATLASRNGVPEAEIAAIMGDDIRTIQKNYVHYRPDYLRASINHHATAHTMKGQQTNVAP